MAAFQDDLGPDLDQFSGCKWTEWEQAVESEGIGGSSQESVSSSLSSRQDKEVATLKREDLGLFGFCPANDNFYLVICEHCHLPFKPQTFQYHVEKHHAGKSHKVENKVKINPPEKRAFAEPTSVTINRSPAPKSSFVSIRNDPVPVDRRPDHKKISVAIKNAFDKVPNSKLMLSRNSASLERKLSGNTVNPHQPHGGAATVPIKEQLRTKFQDGMQKPIPKKPHKPVRVTAEKLGKLELDRTKKPSFVNKSHHHSAKHNMHSHYPPNKLMKMGPNAVKSAGVDLDSSTSLHSSSSSSPELILKKLPMSESQHKESAFCSAPKQMASSSEPLRQYKHNHNPQFEIVKPVDRETDKIVIKNSNSIRNASMPSHSYMAKSEKNVPLKAREYDPNKHCGVRVESTNLPCTRSLTCKTHALRHKRKVLGRRKPYDELVSEQSRLKQRLKEQAEQTKSQSIAPRDSDSAAAEHHSKPFVVTKLTASEVEEMRVPKTPSMHDVKSPTQSSTPQKPKNLIRLFPHTPAPRHIDCWKDTPPELELEQAPDPNQHYISHPPKPLAVNTFNGWMLADRQPVYNRRSHYVWRNITAALNSCPPSSKATKNEQPRTRINFTPVPSASIPESVKASSERMRRCSCSDDISSIADSVFTNYAMSPAPLTGSFSTHQTTHNSLFKSVSIDNSALTHDASTSRKSLAKKLRTKRNTVDMAKSPKRLSQIPSQADITTSANLPISGPHDATDIVSLLSQGSDQYVAPSESPADAASLSFVTPVDSVFKVPNDVSGMLGSVPGNSVSQSPTSGRKRNLSGKGRHNSLIKPTVKLESSPLNGLSSSALTAHAWPHSVTHAGNGALHQKNTTANNNIADTVSLDLTEFTQGTMNCIEDITHNTSNNNNNNLHSQASSFEVLLTSSPQQDPKGVGPQSIGTNGQADLIAAVGQSFDLHQELGCLTSPQTEQISFSNDARLWKS